jgi:hypothetical protein
MPGGRRRLMGTQQGPIVMSYDVSETTTTTPRMLLFWPVEREVCGFVQTAKGSSSLSQFKKCRSCSVVVDDEEAEGAVAALLGRDLVCDLRPNWFGARPHGNTVVMLLHCHGGKRGACGSGGGGGIGLVVGRGRQDPMVVAVHHVFLIQLRRQERRQEAVQWWWSKLRSVSAETEKNSLRRSARWVQSTSSIVAFVARVLLPGGLSAVLWETEFTRKTLVETENEERSGRAMWSTPTSQRQQCWYPLLSSPQVSFAKPVYRRPLGRIIRPLPRMQERGGKGSSGCSSRDVGVFACFHDIVRSTAHMRIALWRLASVPFLSLSESLAVPCIF